MNLRKSRSVISLLVTLLFSVSLTCALTAVFINITFASSSFMEKRFVTKNLVQECEAQLDLQFEVLSVKSGIPARVFKNIENETSVENALKSSVHSVYSHIDTQAAKDTKAQYFYNLCIEYLDGNNLSYNKQDIENSAAEAADIYDKCLGMSNTEHLIDFVDGVKLNAPSAALGLFAWMFIFGALFFVIYKNKKRAFSYVSTGISVSGVTFVLVSAVSLIFKISTRFAMTPAAHYYAMCSVIRLFFIIIFAAGMLLILVGTVGNIMIYNNQKKKERR